jgi:hypothetical protein
MIGTDSRKHERPLIHVVVDSLAIPPCEPDVRPSRCFTRCSGGSRDQLVHRIDVDPRRTQRVHVPRICLGQGVRKARCVASPRTAAVSVDDAWWLDRWLGGDPDPSSQESQIELSTRRLHDRLPAARGTDALATMVVRARRGALAIALFRGSQRRKPQTCAEATRVTQP